MNQVSSENNYPRTVGLIAIFFAFVSAISAQSGGTFQVDKSVVTAGGGLTAGGSYTMDFTIAQPIAGMTAAGQGFTVDSGFWTAAIRPTAATAVIRGRIVSTSGSGIGGVSVSLADMIGAPRIVRTGSLGYFNFNSVPVGRTYLVSTSSNRWTFVDPVIVVTVNDDITDLNFTAYEL